MTGIGIVAGQQHMIIANDATVKAGALFPMTAKKVLRAQRIAFANRLPLIYLVDSAGVFSRCKNVFPDEDDFGRIFRNNAVISAAGIPQIAAIMGNCVAGGGYLPVLCDKLLMTEGSGLYLAGPASSKVPSAKRYPAKNLAVPSCTPRLAARSTITNPATTPVSRGFGDWSPCAADPHSPPAPFAQHPAVDPARPIADLYDLIDPDARKDYEVRDVLSCIVDGDSFAEYKAEYGPTLVCGTARIGGFPVGIVRINITAASRRRGNSNSAE